MTEYVDEQTCLAICPVVTDSIMVPAGCVFVVDSETADHLVELGHAVIVTDGAIRLPREFDGVD